MNSKINWTLKVDKNIYKEILKFPKKDTERIIEAIEFLANDPYFGDIEKIKGEINSWRRRVGSYRIFYDIYKEINVIEVTNIERRTSSTY
jgi:mRNA-degrading endonuclease RelE of RelBE toxin-antitoxin system